MSGSDRRLAAGVTDSTAPTSARDWWRALTPVHLVPLGGLALGLLVAEEFSGVTRPFQRLSLLLESSVMNAAVFVVVAVILALLSLSLLRVRSRIVSLSALAIFILGTAAELSFNVFTGTGFSEDFVAISMREIGMAPEAVRTYADSRVLIAIFMPALVWMAIYVLVRRRSWFGPLAPRNAAIVLIAVLMALTVSWRVRFDHFRLFPIQLRPLLNVTQFYIEQRSRPPRVDPQVSLIDGPLASNRIVMIVDESIRPDYLSLNGYDRPTTPFLESIAGRLINFGTAVSGSTCSDASNVILNSYVRPEHVDDRHAIQTRPTIFQLAKRAGFRTVMLSGVFKSPLFYGIRKSDLQHIDDVVMINLEYDDAKYFNDHHLVQELGELFGRYGDEKLFVYMRKQGTHFPFDDYYPASERPFKPIIGNAWPVHGYKSELLNSYLNGIRWNLDEFYKLLDREIGDSETIILYTSDHGEDIELEAKKLFHCGIDRSMAIVPLWLDVRGEATRERFYARFGDEFGVRNRDRTSHMNVLPTLLRLMNIETTDLTLFDDLSGQVRNYYPPGYHGTYRTMPFDDAAIGSR